LQHHEFKTPKSNCNSVSFSASLVWSTISYGAAIWGTNEYSCINAVQNRAMRFYLGVGKYTANISVIGDRLV
jgi:hypothetical protein